MTFDHFSRVKVGVPKSKTTIIWTPIFEWYVVRCRSKNWHHKDMCLRKDCNKSSNYDNHLGSIVTEFGGDLHGQLMSTRIFTLIINNIFI